MATVHCLAGCSIGEIAGMVIGTAVGWENLATVMLSIGLAFVSGYSLTLLPLLRGGFQLVAALKLALAADTVSIAIMEVVDNAVMMVVRGAMEAGLARPLFWGSMFASLLIAGLAAYPVNAWLIRRGRGHVHIHAHH